MSETLARDPLAPEALEGALIAALGPTSVFTGEAAQERAQGAWLPMGKPVAVVLPRSTAEVSEVLKIALGLQSPILEAHCRYGLGLVSAHRGDASAARGEYEKAAALFEKLNEKEEAAKARKALAAL